MAGCGAAPRTHYSRSDRELDRPLDVLNVSDTHFKEQLVLRFESGVTEDGFDLAQSDWILPTDTPREFVRHMMGDVVLEEKNSHGYTVRTWHKVGSNHYLDCTKFMLAVRHVLRENLRELGERKSLDGGNAHRVTGEKPEGWDEG